MTHHAKVPNGLDVTNLIMSDGMSSHTKTNMKAGWYFNDSGERITQSMQFENGVQKGVKNILTERGKHKNAEGEDPMLQCKLCREKITEEGRNDTEITNLYCATFVLSQEPDFSGQEEWLTEVARHTGFEILFYPKYHISRWCGDGLKTIIVAPAPIISKI